MPNLRWLAPLVILLLLLGGGVLSLLRLSRATSSVQHTDEARRVLMRVVSLLVDAETGQRGYLVDGNRRFLEPYDRARAAWPEQFDRLRALTADNPDQKRRLAELDELIKAKFAELRDSMTARDSGVRDSDLDTRMLRGKETMDAIRQLADEIDREEQRLGSARQQAVQRLWRLAMLLFVSAGFLLVLLVGAGWMQQRSEAARRRLTEERARSLLFAEQFIGILGHDLRNPLNAITMSASLLKRKGDGVDKSPDRILSSARRMSTMVAQLLDLTRSRLGGGIGIERRETDLGAVVSGIVDEQRAAQPARAIRWEPSGQLRGAWDPDRLAQVVSNLIGNALEHGDPTKPVDVKLGVEGETAIFSVHNEGPPIVAEALRTIFDPYRRGSAREAKTRGLGLGLYITQQIVLAHGGRIEVRSTAEEGTTFAVLLPRAAVGEEHGR